MKPAQAKLGDIATVTLGITFRGADASRHDPAGTHQLIRIGDLGPDGAIHIGQPHLVALPTPTAERFALRGGEVLLASRGTRMTAAVFEGGFPAVVGGQFLVIRPKENLLLPAYLRWFLNLPQTQGLLMSMALGTHVASLSAQVLSLLEVPLPPLARQSHIAHLHSLLLQEKQLVERLARLRADLVNASILRSLET